MQKMKKVILFGLCILLLVGCQKEELTCNVVIYSNGTTIFTPESCNPKSKNDVSIDFDLNKSQDKYMPDCFCPTPYEYCYIENCSITYTMIRQHSNK
jgi:hypothetical protein